jgi:integrase
VKLDAKSVVGVQLEGKADRIVFDDAMPGFGYRLRRGTGGKVLRSWIVQYRRGGRSRRLLLGSADVLGIEQARAAAKKALGAVALGQDPQADKVARRDKDRTNLKSVVDEYLADKQSRARPQTMYEAKRYLTGVYLKPLHDMPIDQVTRRDVAAQLVVVARKNGKVTARIARATLSAFYTWAMRMGIVEANPVIGTAPPDESSKPRQRVLSDHEFVAIWKACADDDFGRIVRLLALTGARRTEVGGMTWGELDLDQGTWTIPAERCKNGRAHSLPLMPTALAIINGVPQRASRDQLFGDRSTAGFTVWNYFKVALDAASGVTDWTLHDIRRTVATRMADLSVAPHVIEQILNHQSGHKGGVAGIYNRSSYQREVAAALALWADHVNALVTGGERKVVAQAVARSRSTSVGSAVRL